MEKMVLVVSCATTDISFSLQIIGWDSKASSFRQPSWLRVLWRQWNSRTSLKPLGGHYKDNKHLNSHLLFQPGEYHYCYPHMWTEPWKKDHMKYTVLWIEKLFWIRNYRVINEWWIQQSSVFKPFFEPQHISLGAPLK